MKNRIRDNQRKNLLFISAALITLMLAVNFTIYYASNTFMTNKIAEENEEFLLLTTYLIEENDLHVAIEYVGHYSDSHDVEVQIFNNNQLLYDSVQNEFKYTEHEIVTTQGTFRILIDNTHSVTVDLLRQKYLLANMVSALLFVFAIMTLYIWNKRASNKIEADVSSILSYIHHEAPNEYEYSYIEFQRIYNNIENYVNELDMHRERKQLNIKGLAHDIKTPLSIINNYLQESSGDTSQKENSLESIKKVSKMIDTLIEDDYKNTFIPINLNNIIAESVEYYKRIFQIKNIKIVMDSETECIINWNQRDFKVILENLLSNAYYYSDENSEFHILITEEDHELHLEFTSEGNVKDLENVNKIFSKGYRDNSTKSLNTHGKGVGLYITKLLLMPINGEIKAEVNGNFITFKISIKKV